MRSPHAFSAVVRRRRRRARRARGADAATCAGAVRAWPLVRGVVASGRGAEARHASAALLGRDLRTGSRQKPGRASSRAPSAPERRAAGCARSRLSLPIIALVTSEPELQPGPSGPAKEATASAQALHVAQRSVFALVLFVALPQAFAAGHELAARPRARRARARGFQLLTGAAKLTIVDRLHAAHPPHARDLPRFSVSRRRAQVDLHLRGGRSAHRRERAHRRRRCTRAAARRSS